MDIEGKETGKWSTGIISGGRYDDECLSAHNHRAAGSRDAAVDSSFIFSYPLSFGRHNITVSIWIQTLQTM